MERVIMGIPFNNLTKKAFIEEELTIRLKNQQKTFVVTANPEIVMKTRQNKAYKEVVQEADYICPDGIGVIYAAKIMGRPLKERIPGIEVVDELLHLAEKEGYACYFLGAEQSVNEKAVGSIQSSFPKLHIAGSHHGFFDIEDRSIAEEVAGTNPDIVFVAIGAPNQEFWISTYQDLFPNALMIGVGGSFDVYAGAVNRAPAFWVKLNLEWLYRIMIQPSRILRIFTSIRFMFLVAIGRGKE